MRKDVLSQNVFQDLALRDYPRIFILAEPVSSFNLFSFQFFQGVWADLMSYPKVHFIHFHPGVPLAAVRN